MIEKRQSLWGKRNSESEVGPFTVPSHYDEHINSSIIIFSTRSGGYLNRDSVYGPCRAPSTLLSSYFVPF
jgi:hypothetical protein